MRLACVGVLAAGLFVCVSAAPVSAQPPPVPAVVDPDVTVGAGATLTNAAGEAAAMFEGLVVPDRLFEERGVGRRGANVAYRVARLLLFDVPQEEWLLVVNHEVFGHGGRVRELIGGYLKYHIDVPRPYGPGGGVTYYELPSDVTVHEIQAITVGGMEVNGVSASLIARRAVAARRISPRSALRYLLFALDGFDYIQNTSDEPERPGHDVSDFLNIYNITAELVGAEPLTPQMLRRQSFISLADTMLVSAAIGVARYVATGNSDGMVLQIPLGPVRVMPVMKFRLTPFGTEWALASEVAVSGHAGHVGVRVGRAPLARPWGLSAGYSGVRLKNWQIDIDLEGWRQPPLALGGQPDFGLALIGAAPEWGGEVRVRAASPLVRFWGSRAPATLIVDAGLKSPGFVPGEPLGQGLVLRAGMGLPLDRR